MVEHTIQENNHILVHASVSKGENVMKAGSDIHKGEHILKQHTLLTSHEIGVLAALGMNKAEVFKRPKVAIISSGA